MRPAVFIFVVANLVASGAPAVEPAFIITIERNMTCEDESTIGRLLINGEEIGRTLELPWRNNEPGISRIPEGTYNATIRTDGKRGWRLQLKNVEGRAFIQIHIGNYQRQIEGCILVGDGTARNGKECMVTNSSDSIEAIRGAIASHAGNEVARMTDADVEIRVQVKN